MRSRIERTDPHAARWRTVIHWPITPFRGSRRAHNPASIWHMRCTEQDAHREIIMVSWAIAFLGIAWIAAAFGCFGLAASAAGFAKIIFVVALILALVSFSAERRPRRMNAALGSRRRLDSLAAER